MANTIEEILRVGFEVDTRGAMRSMAKFRQQVNQQVQRMVQATNNIGRANAKMNQQAARSVSDWQAQYDDLADAQDAYARSAVDAARRVGKAEERTAKMVHEQTKLLKQQVAERRKSMKAGARGGAAVGDPRTAKKAGKSFGAEIDEAFSRGGKMSSRQMRKETSKAGKQAIKDTLAGGGRRSLGGMGGMGGGKDMKMPDLSGLKGLGGLMKTLGPLVGTLAKIGPVLGTISTAVVGLIKLMIDAEAQAKEFQKSILDSASNAEFLAANARDADAAFYDMAETVRAVRNAAFDFNALMVEGLDTQDFQGTVNALNQEGITFKKIGELAYNRRKEGENYHDTVKRTTIEITKMGVAYSKALGVPLQEINQLQAEMMTEMGQSLDETRLSFAQMTRAATESTIASNKFFAMIRGVSQDLSLYNTRIGSAAKLLSKLGKAMSPRNAQKFLQTATQGLKTMDQDARLRLNLLTGNKGQQIVTDDLNRKTDLMSKDILAAFAEGSGVVKERWGGKQVDEIKAILEAGGEGRARLLRDLEDMGKGSLVEAADEIKMDRAAAKKGQYGVATAMGNLSAGAALDMKKAGLMSLSGGAARSISDAIGELGFEKTAQMLGIGEDEVRGMAKLEMSLERQREILKADLSSNDESRKAQAEAALEQAGLTKEKLDTASFGSLMETLSSEERKQLEDDASTQEQLAAKQKQLTESMLQKLEKLMNFIMNQVYEVMLSIYEAVAGIWGKSQEASNKIARMRAGKEVGGEVGTLAGEQDFAKALAGSKTNQAMLQAMRDIDRAIELRNKDKLTEKEQKELKSLEGVEARSGELMKMRSEMMKAVGPQAVLDAAKMSGMGEKGLALLQKKMDLGVSADEAINQMYADDDKRRQVKEGITSKLAWTESTGELVTQFGKIEKLMSELGYMKGGPAPTAAKGEEKGKGKADAQQKASAKAGGPSAPSMPAEKKVEAPATPVAPVAPQPQERRPGAAAGEAALTGRSKEVPATAKGQGTLHEDMASLEKQLGQKGIRYEKGFLRSDFGKQVEDSVLDAMRVALMEYALYKDTASTDLAGMLKGIDPKAFSRGLMDEVKAKGVLPKEFGGGGEKGKKGGAQQKGGYIVGTNPDGSARVLTPPAGEVPIYAAPGEAVLNSKQQRAVAGGQRGGGGDLHLHVQVNGVGGQDLAAYVEKAASNAVYEYKRREGLT